MYPILHVINSLKEYHTELVSKEVSSLWELNLIGTSFNSVLEEAEGFQGRLQDFGQNFLGVNQASEQFATVREEIAQSVGQAQNEVESLKSSSMEVETHFSEMGSTFEALQESVEHIKQRMTKIVSIADQTNILAINASIEAARAGEAGKGFAVVADEVRNLASKSATASNSTSELIQGTANAVDKGRKIANETAESLMKVVDSVQIVSGIVDQIADASMNQSESLGQVTEGMNQISSVVQTNSATAEEGAATSEELSSQAQVLRNLVSQFKLRSDS